VPSIAHEIESHVARIILSERGWAQYQHGDVGHQELAPYRAALDRLSSLYVGHTVGKQLTTSISHQIEAEAYALYYLPINAAKISTLLPLLDPVPTPLRVLDFGCGPGTASLALALSIGRPLALTCVDSAPHMRAVAQRLLSTPPCAEKLLSLSIADTIPAGQYDLIVAANVFAELDEQEQSRLLRTFLSQLAPKGFMLFMEPGQQMHTRRLMTVRDQVVRERPDIRPLFPCLRGDPCPMLKSSSDDWCHGVIEWQQPPLSRQLDTLLGFNKHRIKYSAFIFQQGATLRSGVRVLTKPHKTPGGINTLVCSNDFYGLVTIRKGRRSQHTSSLTRARVFDRLAFSEPAREELPFGITIEKLST